MIFILILLGIVIWSIMKVVDNYPGRKNDRRSDEISITET